MSNQNKIKRNSFVVAMNKRNKTQIFHHKTEERGGAYNEERDLIDQDLLEKEDEDTNQ